MNLTKLTEIHARDAEELKGLTGPALTAHAPRLENHRALWLRLGGDEAAWPLAQVYGQMTGKPAAKPAQPKVTAAK